MYHKMERSEEVVKENVVRREPMGLRWLLAALGAAAAALALAARQDRALPEPLSRAAPPDRFSGQRAHDLLVNLTAVGPRVAGSYESDVVAAGLVVAAAREAARLASPHARVDIDVQRVSGAFPLAFMDGMNHVYHDVQNVVVRVRAAGDLAPQARRSALLLNCHIDTVPDSPGASDDGAGCAVLLETLRALAAARSPPRHDVIFLFNGAEENVLQGSHGFITQHKWARSVRAFINVEACGAGGREVLFQAGPRDPWILETYAGAAPHPFASSLAQELFESGLVPADTDFRIFRDFGGLSGVDLAWTANGYVYHTALDTAERVPPAALQRTGDNVLALAHGLLARRELGAAGAEGAAGGALPVYFDVLGVLVLSARAPAALAAAALALALPLLDVHLAARRAQKDLLLSYGGWWRLVGAGAACWLLSHAAGLACAACVGAVLHAAHVRLAFYSQPALLAPLYALPGMCGAWLAARALCGACARRCGRGGWWAARALQQGGGACAAAALALAVLARLRSGFLPALWAALPALAGVAHSALGGGGAPGWWWALGAALPCLQTWYLAVPSLRMFVPVAGRAGAAALPPDVGMAVLTAGMALGACSWLLPLVVATRRPLRLVWCMAAACACACAWAACGGAGAAYSAQTPQRLLVFHARRTQHAALEPRAEDLTDHLYWMPQLDVNAPRNLRPYADELRAAEPVSAAECAARPYCGMPYYLPVRRLLPASHRARAPAPPAPRLLHELRRRQLNSTHAQLDIAIRDAAHAVLVVGCGRGARVAWSSALAAPREAAGAGPGVYFFALHCARPRALNLTLVFERAGEAGEAGDAASGSALSLAAHALHGAAARTAEHVALLARLPRWVTASGWGVDLHLYRL